jgi:lipopolysaccharide transport system ATP-binding protein
MSEHGIAVGVSGVSRMFKRYRHPRHRVMEVLGLPLPKNAFDEFWALRDISFEVKRGDSLAIIGQNGAGKSTLLSIVCGRLQPSSGTVTVRGRIQALMDLGTGFHPEFTGVRNIYSALAYQGITGAEADRRYEEIVEFSELGEFIGQPIKTYSTGMYARLAFSTATAVEPDVLIIDEILSAGDAYFAAKCAHRMRRLTQESGATVLFVSHDLGAVQRLCERAIWIDRGQIRMAGSALEISKSYYADVLARDEARLRAQTTAAIARMKGRGGAEEVEPVRRRLLARLVAADGQLPRASHPVRRIALVTADGRRFEARLGAPMDNDGGQAAHITTDPAFVLWSRPVQVAGEIVRRFEATGGKDRQAPIWFQDPSGTGWTGGSIEIEHAAMAGDPVALEVHEPAGYRRLGVLTPAQAPHAWRVDRLPIAGPVAMIGPANGFASCSTEDEENAGGDALTSGSRTLQRARDGGPRDKWESSEARFLDICTADTTGTVGQSMFKLGEPITFEIGVALRVPVPTCWLAGIIFDAQGNRVFLGVHKFENGLDAGESEILFRLGSTNLRQGEYVGSFELLPIFDYYWPHPHRIPYLCHWDRCVYFKIEEDYRGSIALGLVALPIEVAIRRLSDRRGRRSESGVPVLAGSEHEPGAS